MRIVFPLIFLILSGCTQYEKVDPSYEKKKATFICRQAGVNKKDFADCIEIVAKENQRQIERGNMMRMDEKRRNAALIFMMGQN